MKKKNFACIGHYIDKQSAKAMTVISEVNEGINKQGQHYAFISDKREVIEGTYPVGTILTATIQFTSETAESAGKATLKITNRQ